MGIPEHSQGAWQGKTSFKTAKHRLAWHSATIWTCTSKVLVLMVTSASWPSYQVIRQTTPRDKDIHQESQIRHRLCAVVIVVTFPSFPRLQGLSIEFLYASPALFSGYLTRARFWKGESVEPWKRADHEPHLSSSSRIHEFNISQGKVTRHQNTHNINPSTPAFKGEGEGESEGEGELSFRQFSGALAIWR